MRRLLKDARVLVGLFVLRPGVSGAPSPGHPESTTKTLPRHEEEWLAFLDLEL